jgi:uncharacterized protein YbaR (Trm112 family)
MALNVCPNCKKDLRDYNDAVHESGHSVKYCPACHFPLIVYEEASNKLDSFGFKIQKEQAW